MDGDHVDWILAAWAREMPDVNTGPIGVVGRLLRAARHLERGVDESLALFGLNITEFNVLAALRRTGASGTMVPTDLSASLLVSSGGLTKRIDRLERDGLVKRAPAPDDRRSVLVVLTPAGRDLVEEAFRALAKKEEQLLSALSGDERGNLSAILRVLLLSHGDGSERSGAEPLRRRARQVQTARSEVQ